jgi:hypothetical protein
MKEKAEQTTVLVQKVMTWTCHAVRRTDTTGTLLIHD